MTRVRANTTVFGLVCWALWAMLPTAVVGAQDAAASGDSVDGPAAAADSSSAAADAALAARRVALIDLRLLESPQAVDYRATYEFMTLLGQIAPDDVDIARYAAAAAFAAGDDELLEQATRRVIRLDPDDTVSQLRLIVKRIAEFQTVEERLAAYDRFLGRGGESIDASVRSRLALDAALLHRERGESDRFVERLTQATELDATNKDAAILAFNYFASQVPDDAVGQLRLQFNLLFADPFDPRVHLSIARLLAQEGAVPQSLRFHNMTLALLDAAGPRGPQRDVERLTLLWELQGPSAVVQEIAGRLAEERRIAGLIYEESLKRDVADEDLVPPETVSLDGLYERMRVLAALAAGDFVQVETGIEELNRIAERAKAILRDPTINRDPAEAAFLVGEAVRAVSDLQFMRAVANVDIEKFDGETRSVAALGPQFRDALAPLAAWIRYRNGDPAGALELADRLERDIGLNVGTSVLRGLANESLGSIDNAMAAYRGIIEEDPLGPYGAWARSRALQLMGSDDPRTPAGRRMAALTDRVPQIIDQMVVDNRLFLEFTLDSSANVVAPGEPIELILTVKNVSAIPLAMGPDRPLNSRIVVIPILDQRDIHTGRGQPEVLELDRRLRLMPLETISVRIRPEGAFNGLINIANDPLLSNQRYRAVQGFQLTPNGQYEPGPLCGSDDTQSMLLEANPIAQRSPEGIVAALTTPADAAELRLAIRAAAAAFMRATPSSKIPPIAPGATESSIEPREAADYEPIPGSPSPEDLRPVVDGLIRAYETADPLTRLFMLATVPPASVTPGLEPFDAAVITSITRPAPAAAADQLLVQATAIATRLRDPDHPAMSAALTSTNAGVRIIAAAAFQRLSAGVPTIGTTGPGFNELAGPTRRAILERSLAGRGR